jgi:hypothetical protein
MHHMIAVTAELFGSDLKTASGHSALESAHLDRLLLCRSRPAYHKKTII